ncbi:MAG: redoxin domain-containing protein [Candidatus Sulfotelmatobacter sp.]
MWRGKFSISLMWLGTLLAVLCGLATAQQALDLDGHAVDPFVAASGKPVVLVFLRRDCPVSGRYAPTIQKISREYAARASFWLVYPDRTDNSQEIRKSVADYGYTLPVLRDPDHALVKLSRVQITPEVAVFDRDRQLIYDGRIDDWYIDLSRARPAPTTHELRDAISAARARTKLAQKEVRGVGCYISDVE